MNDSKRSENGLIALLIRYRRHSAVLCLMAVSAMSMGCYGRFPMTHALYNLNGGIDNKIIRNIAFWLLVFFPIYWFAQVGDAVIFNLIEFWTGSGLDLSSVSQDGDRTVTLKSSEDRSELLMTLSKVGEPDVTSRFVRLEDGRYEMRNEENDLLGQIIRTPEGNLDLTDAQGHTLRTINLSEFALATAN